MRRMLMHVWLPLLAALVLTAVATPWLMPTFRAPLGHVDPKYPEFVRNADLGVVYANGSMFESRSLRLNKGNFKVSYSSCTRNYEVAEGQYFAEAELLHLFRDDGMPVTYRIILNGKDRRMGAFALLPATVDLAAARDNDYLQQMSY